MFKAIFDTWLDKRERADTDWNPIERTPRMFIFAKSSEMEVIVENAP